MAGRSIENSLMGVPLVDVLEQSNATLTASGNGSVHDITGSNVVEVHLIVANNPTGTSPTLTVTLTPIDPSTGAALSSSKKSTSSITAAGDAELIISSYAGQVVGTKAQVSWAVSGTSPSFSGVTIRFVARR
jgi:hypothetical protein